MTNGCWSFTPIIKMTAAKRLRGLSAPMKKMWGEDLTSLPGFAEAVAGYLGDIEKNGMYAAMKAVFGLE